MPKNIFGNLKRFEKSIILFYLQLHNLYILTGSPHQFQMVDHILSRNYLTHYLTGINYH